MSYQFLRNKRNWIDKASFCFKRITSYITQLNTLVYTHRGIYSDLGDKGEARPVGLFPVFQQRLSHWQHSHVTRYGTTKTNSRSRFSCFIMQHPLCHPLFTWKFPSAFKPMYKYNHNFGGQAITPSPGQLRVTSKMKRMKKLYPKKKLILQLHTNYWLAL